MVDLESWHPGHQRGRRSQTPLPRSQTPLDWLREKETWLQQVGLSEGVQKYRLNEVVAPSVFKKKCIDLGFEDRFVIHVGWFCF